MSCQRLGEIDAYIPACAESSGAPGGAVSAGVKWLKNDYRAAVAIPQYAVVDGEEKIVTSFVGLTKDAGRFLKFLEGAKAQPAAAAAIKASL